MLGTHTRTNIPPVDMDAIWESITDMVDCDQHFTVSDLVGKLPPIRFYAIRTQVDLIRECLLSVVTQEGPALKRLSRRFWILPKY